MTARKRSASRLLDAHRCFCPKRDPPEEDADDRSASGGSMAETNGKRLSLAPHIGLGRDGELDTFQAAAIRGSADLRSIVVDDGDAGGLPRRVQQPRLVRRDHGDLDHSCEQERYQRQAERELDGCLPALIACPSAIPGPDRQVSRQPCETSRSELQT
jgi:hypothetical protein